MPHFKRIHDHSSIWGFSRQLNIGGTSSPTPNACTSICKCFLIFKVFFVSVYTAVCAHMCHNFPILASTMGPRDWIQIIILYSKYFYLWVSVCVIFIYVCTIYWAYLCPLNSIILPFLTSFSLRIVLLCSCHRDIHIFIHLRKM